jgi:phosphatidylethanolamine-binding protein (PEBP) family uncharacterized protein
LIHIIVNIKKMITEEINKKLKEWNEKTPSNVGVGYGFKQTDGVYTDEICIVFSVKEKKPLSDLSEDEVLPSEIKINENKTVSTDVIQVGEVYALQCSRTTPITPVPPICEPFILNPPTNRSAFATLKGGISITSVRKANSIGTLGMIVQDLNTNALVGLTNNHVVVGNSIAAQYQNLNPILGNNFPITNEITPSNFSCQPGEFGYQSNVKFGQVIRYVPITPYLTTASNIPAGAAYASPTGLTKNNVDAALVSIDCNKIDFNNSWKFSGFENLMTSPLPFATTSEINNLLVTNPQLYSTGRSTGPKGLGTPGCELRIHQINVSTDVGGYSWHVSGGVQYGTVADYNPRLIAFYKPSGVPSQPHCLWPCAAGDSGSMLIANLGTQAVPIFKVIGLVFAGNSLPGYPVAVGPQNVFNTNFSALANKPDYNNWLGYACRIDDVANELAIKAWTGGTAPLVNPSTISTITLPGLNPLTATTCQNKYYYQVGTTMTYSPCATPSSITVSSSNFLNGQTLTNTAFKHPSCGGQNNSPSLSWVLNNILPSNVINYSLLMEDINAIGTSPNGYFIHWRVTNIQPTQTSINSWISGPSGWQAGATIQQTDWSPSAVNPNGYGGPCVAGHTYRISITATITPAGGGGTITSNLLTFISG